MTTTICFFLPQETVNIRQPLNLSGDSDVGFEEWFFTETLAYQCEHVALVVAT